MPKKKKGEKKSLSVNDIPIAKNTNQLMRDMDEEAFGQLLSQCAQSKYNRKSEGALNTINDEENGIVNIVEKNLRDEDAEKERMKREERNKNEEEHPPRQYSSSPPVPEIQRQHRTLYARDQQCFASCITDDLDFIDSNSTDVEMQDLTQQNIDRKPPPPWTRGNEEKVCEEHIEDEESRGPVRKILPYFEPYQMPYTEPKTYRPLPNRQIQGQQKLEVPQTNSLVEQKKRQKELKRQKENQNIYVVPSGNCMGDSAIEDLINYIGPIENKNDSARQDRRRSTKEGNKKGTASATIGNHQGKAQAAAPSNKPQTVNVNGSNVTKESKKSPNKKNKKGSNVANNNNAAPRVAGRVSTEDAEEEFLSADEGIVSSNSDEVNLAATARPSDVMMDGGNYLADSDELPCHLDNHNNEEDEFTTVGRKKKGNTTQTAQRTGSTGKVERRGNVQRPEVQQQLRRNSMEDRPKARPRPQAAASLGDYLDEKKPETHHKAKVAPFKERKKHGHLESTEYMDAQDEMVIPTPTSNGTTTPERTFSYADAAKKSAEQSRENSPACVNQVTGTPTVTPPPSEQNSTPGGSKHDEFPPVSMPDSSDKTTDNTVGLSFFYEEGVKSDLQSGGPCQTRTDGAFVLNLGGKAVRFAMGMAAPTAIQPIDDRHRQMVDLMMDRWQIFTSTGPAPVYYTPTKSTVQV